MAPIRRYLKVGSSRIVPLRIFLDRGVQLQLLKEHAQQINSATNIEEEADSVYQTNEAGNLHKIEFQPVSLHRFLPERDIKALIAVVKKRIVDILENQESLKYYQKSKKTSKAGSVSSNTIPSLEENSNLGISSESGEDVNEPVDGFSDSFSSTVEENGWKVKLIVHDSTLKMYSLTVLNGVYASSIGKGIKESGGVFSNEQILIKDVQVVEPTILIEDDDEGLEDVDDIDNGDDKKSLKIFYRGFRTLGEGVDIYLQRKP
ncbi:hypothetical protein NADFUDRAFT_77390 [Nadsonia fulvescens var. elongata DSM 6958]|uniref:Uncharacterized protein n=1 Tax=Nadsonia fulvescens var. elongata DSM 6958 TaxID=857566 RepID=A0A1E3PPP4_9ASCO|nr:hypothetical protein NADFUDRAFT_77390 [Nadsonia fulvescens var. elongata DSM 6958]